MEYRDLIIGIVIVGFPLLIVEVICRLFNLSGEISRKVVHLISAFCTIVLSHVIELNGILFIAGFFVLLMMVMRKFKILTSLYKVGRDSLGELAFPVGVFFSALLTDSKRSFIVAMLILGIADTLAFIVGSKFGKLNKAFKLKKSFIGSFAFFVVSLFIMAIMGFSLSQVVVVSLVATIIELISPNGTDNLTIPLTVILCL